MKPPRSLVASLLLSSVLAASLTPQSSEAAIVLVVSSMGNGVKTQADYAKYVRTKRGIWFGLVGLVGYGALQVYGGVSLPVIPGWALMGMFLDQPIRSIGELQADDLLNNGYSREEVALAMQDLKLFREKLESTNTMIQITAEDTEATVAQAIRQVYPGASDVLVEVLSKGMFQAGQAS